MEITFTYIKLLKFNLEYLIKCLDELESITKSSSLLKSRASAIIDYPIESFLRNKNLENLSWIMEATRTFTRFYPENIYNSNVELLDKEINRLYYLIVKISYEISNSYKAQIDSLG